MNSIHKYSLIVDGHKTSVSLEGCFWAELQRSAGERGIKVSNLVNEIAAARDGNNLSSAIRIFVLGDVRRTPLVEAA